MMAACGQYTESPTVVSKLGASFRVDGMAVSISFLILIVGTKRIPLSLTSLIAASNGWFATNRAIASGTHRLRPPTTG